MGKKRFLGVAVTVAIPVIVIAIILAIRIKSVANRLDMTDYVKVDILGLNSRAYVESSFDTEKLYCRIAGAKASTEKREAYKTFVESVKYDIDKVDSLSNGDVITLKVSYDEEEAKKNRIKIKNSEKTITVAELANGTRLDPFADIKIITTGTSPYVNLAYVNETKNTYLAKLEYSFDKSENLAIGDEFTITCKADEKNAASHGFYFAQLSLKGVIQDADRYVKSVEELSEENIEAFVTADTELLKAEVADTTYHMSYKITGDKRFLYRDGNESLERIDRYETRIIANSSGEEQNVENYLVMIYSASIAIPIYTNTADPYEHLSLYFAVIYPNAIITCDGELIYDEAAYVGAKNIEDLNNLIVEYTGME